MFSNITQKRIARLVSTVMLTCNLYPVSARVIDGYEYQVSISPMISGFDVHECNNGFAVNVSKRSIKFVDGEEKSYYESVFDRDVTRFMSPVTNFGNQFVKMYEILQKVNGVHSQVYKDSDESCSPFQKEIATEVSRGYCLNIPEIGDLLISHDGDVVFDTQIAIGKSISISSPSQVILNNTTAKDIDVEASFAIITGNTKTKLNSLNFRGNGKEATNGLFIDKESALEVRKLNLVDSILLNTGKLSVIDNMDLNGGSLFNTGSIRTSANPSSLTNVSYLFNGSEGVIDASSRMIINASHISNSGIIKAADIGIVASILFDNRGKIESSSSLELETIGDSVNFGKIKGRDISVFGNKFTHQSGEISGVRVNLLSDDTVLYGGVKGDYIKISGKNLDQKSGEIKGKKIDFNSEKSLLRGKIDGQETRFSGIVQASGIIDVLHGVIEGGFINSSMATNFGNLLELIGTRAEIKNEGKIFANNIRSTSEKAIIEGGEFSTKSVLISKYFQFSATAPKLEEIKVDQGGSVLFLAESFLPKLRRIDTSGNINFLCATPELSTINVGVSGSLQLEHKGYLPRLKSVSDVKGKLFTKSSMPSLGEAIVSSGGYIKFMDGAKLSGLSTILTKKDSTLIFEKSVLTPLLKDIYNSGVFSFENSLMNLDSIYNAKTGTMHFLAQVKVAGRVLNPRDRLEFNTLSLSDNNISIFNEGNMIVKLSSTISELNFLITRNYISSQNAMLRLEAGGLKTTNDIINEGIIYSISGLLQKQYRKVTKWGKCVAEKDIRLEANREIFELDKTYEPIVKGTKKTLKIESDVGFDVHEDVALNVDLEVVSPSFDNKNKLTVKSFKAKTDSFKNTGTISSKDSFDIDAKELENISGRIQTHGDVRIKVLNKFTNTGGGTVKHNEQIQLTYYSASGNSYQTNTKTYYSDFYTSNFAQAGVITCGGLLDINCGIFDNIFGILTTAKSINIISLGDLMNSCGLIYSSGDTNINCINFKNGYLSGENVVDGVDPSRPLYANEMRSYQQWVQSGYHKKKGGFKRALGHKKWVDTSHYETRYRNECVLKGYESMRYSTAAARYPGYIFSKGSIRIDGSPDMYIGTIVSELDILLNGGLQNYINSDDRGHLVARGNLFVEMEQANIARWRAEAQNISFFLNDVILGGGAQTFCINNEDIYRVIDIEKFALNLGLVIHRDTFRALNDENIVNNSVGDLIPVDPSASDLRSIYIAHENAVLRGIGTSFFMPTIQNEILNQVLRIILAPYYGRDILMRDDFVDDLRQTGMNVIDFFMRVGRIPDLDQPALFFTNSDEAAVDLEIDGERQIVALYKPILAIAERHLQNIIRAEQTAQFRAVRDVIMNPGGVLDGIDAPNINIKAGEKLTANGVYEHDNTGARIGVKPVVIRATGLLFLSGDRGVETRGTQVSAENIAVESSYGDIVDESLVLDRLYRFGFGNRTVTSNQDVIPSVFHGSEGIIFNAPRGSINLEGSRLFSGVGGIHFNSQSCIMRPAESISTFFTSNARGYSSSELISPIAGVMHSEGQIVFQSPSTSLIGVEIVSKSLVHPVDGKISVSPSYTRQKNKSLQIKNGFLGRSSLIAEQTLDLVNQSKIITDHLIILGLGTFDIESSIVNALDGIIRKNINERAAYDRVKSVVVQKSSGFFAPKICGDPFVDAVRGIKSVVTIGDIAPNALNVVATTAQTFQHALTLSNLQNVQNPLVTVGQIFATRFLSNFGYSNVKAKTVTEEKRPVQSNIDIGVLKISNDSTHLEGVWKVNDAEINTGKFTSMAPMHEVKQNKEMSGWSVSINPLSMLFACVSPSALTMCGTLPNISITTATKDIRIVENNPQKITADKLVIRCDNAVFSGAQIHTRLLDAIVNGDVTIEDLRREFSSVSTNKAFSGSLAGLTRLIKDKAPPKGMTDTRFTAIPRIHMVEESELSQTVQNIAEIVGTENFYLKVGGLLHKKSAKVGLVPEGVVVHSDAEKIDAKRILDEKIAETQYKDRRVFNPCIGEFFSAMQQIDELNSHINELNAIRAKVAERQMLDNVPKVEREKVDEAVKEFIEKPEVVETYKKFKEAQHKQQIAEEQVALLENEYSEIFGADQNVQDEFSALMANHTEPSAAERLEAIFEWSRARMEVEKHRDQAMEAMVSINNYLDDYAQKHPTATKLMHHAIQAVGYIAIGAVLAAAAPLGATALLATAGTLCTKDAIAEIIIAKGSDYVVEYCAARGGTEEDAVRYGLAAHGVIDKVLVGVGFAGVKTLTKRGKRVRLTKVDAINLSKKTYRDKVSAERIAKNAGRSGRQSRLRSVMTDDKQASYIRGWIKQRKNAGKPLSLPPGHVLAHRRGYEAAKGYDYKFADPQLKDLHDTQHKHDKMGRLNKDRGKK